MVYGPCGGVRADHGCELADRPCPFAGRPPLRWAGPPAPAPAGSPRVPLVLTDLTVRPYDPASLRRVVRILAPASDGLLVGEHQNRPDLPPTLLAAEVFAAGGRPWPTLTCRDRRGGRRGEGRDRHGDPGGGVSSAMESEFDLVAAWTEQAVADLGPDYAIAAGCRGSGSPSGLAWLAEALEVHLARRMLDAGAGVGGPAAWLAGHFDVTPVCADPMPAAVRASRRLFGLPAVVAAGEALPFPDGAFDAAWSLGVLCATSGKAELLAELRRVLGPVGRLGLLVFVATGPLPPPLPAGNDFPTDASLAALLTGAGFTALQTVEAGALPDTPVSWQARADRVEAAMAERHGDDPRWAESVEQTARIARLIADGHLRPTLVHAVVA